MNFVALYTVNLSLCFSFGQQSVGFGNILLYSVDQTSLVELSALISRQYLDTILRYLFPLDGTYCTCCPLHFRDKNCLTDIIIHFFAQTQFTKSKTKQKKHDKYVEHNAFLLNDPTRIKVM